MQPTGGLLSRNRLNLVLALVFLLSLFVINVVLLSSNIPGFSLKDRRPVSAGPDEQKLGSEIWRPGRPPTPFVEAHDQHPIVQLMQDADNNWDEHVRHRSKTFKATVIRYRQRFGRHPPPGFKQWYKFARQRHVFDIDDFGQIQDDLRPFWGLSPHEIRKYAAHASDHRGYALAIVHVRGGEVFQKTWDSWRLETFISLLRGFAQHLPDMDIALNTMDQPRVVVPWAQMQAYLDVEVRTRSLPSQASDAFTPQTHDIFVPQSRSRWSLPWTPTALWPSTKEERGPDWGWYAAQGQQFMKIASKACPPESFAVDTNLSISDAEKSYKHPQAKFITNFNTSSDLCTVGPQIQDLHGMLYASASMYVTERLVPVFGECKVNVNSDILFPANMYWKKDKRYMFNKAMEVSWDNKRDDVLWRGVTSGGTQFEDSWRNMHRQRLVTLLNSTVMGNTTISILGEDSAMPGVYRHYPVYQPSFFAQHHADVGFTEKVACIPNCDFYNDTFTMLGKTKFAEQFNHKYLVDVDGHSFSGRWRAFLLSKSLGIKATIFREWHDSRLFAWRHFVPMDNRYDDLYSLLTYFIGVNSNTDTQVEGRDETNPDLRVPRHDYEAMKLAKQGQDWAKKVLRREDMEIYTYRLLLEYGRVIDDDRDKIGIADDGGEEMEEFDRLFPAL